MRWFDIVRHGSWTDRLVLTIVATLLLGPAWILVAGDKPSRFGFQMYSGYGDVTAAWTDADGVEHDVETNDYVASTRGEVDWTRILPDVLCARIPEAVSVRVSRTQPGKDAEQRRTC